MRLKFKNRNEEPVPLRSIPDVPMMIIEDEPAGNIYRAVLSDPVFRNMDYRRSCPNGEREECQRMALLIALRQQYKQNYPELYRKGVPGPDAQQFLRLEDFCKACIITRERSKRRRKSDLPRPPVVIKRKIVTFPKLKQQDPVDDGLKSDLSLKQELDELIPDDSPIKETRRTSGVNEARTPSPKAVQLPKDESPAAASNTNPMWMFPERKTQNDPVVAEGATDALKVAPAEDVPIKLVDDHSPGNDAAGPAPAPKETIRCEKCNPPRDVPKEKWDYHQAWHKGRENRAKKKAR